MSKSKAMQALDRAATGILVICAIIITALVAHRELVSVEGEDAISYYEAWEDLTDRGNRLGKADAPVQMVVFFDYQCPFCRRVEPTIERLRAKYGDDLSVTFRHFLLETIHPEARAAALAAECAADQGRFEPMHHLLFENAAELGTLPWVEFAERAAVPDLDRFQECFSDGRHNDRIVEDQTVVAELGILSIPGIVINGNVVTGAKPFEVFDGIIQKNLEETEDPNLERTN